MKNLAKFIAWVYFITMFVLICAVGSFATVWLSMIVAFMVIMQVMGWLKIARAMAIIMAVASIWWIINTTSFAGLLDVAYAVFFTWYFFKEGWK
jgi:hypothetical protein